MFDAYIYVRFSSFNPGRIDPANTAFVAFFTVNVLTSHLEQWQYLNRPKVMRARQSTWV